MLNQHHTSTTTTDTSRMTNFRRRGALASAGLALMLLLGACGDDDGSTTATDSTDSAEDSQDVSGSGSEDSAPEPSDTDERPLEDPSNAADGDNMVVDDPNLDTGGDADPAAGGSSFNPVAGSWTLESLTIEGDMAIPLVEGATVPTLEVQGTDVSGTDGCNTYGGTATYDIAGDSFAIGDIAATEIACEDDVVSSWFNQALNAATSFSSEPGVLILTDNAAAPTTMRFTINAINETPDEGLEDPDDELSAPIGGIEDIGNVGDIAEAYIGLPLEEAEAMAEENGQPFRVMNLDGEEFGGTADVVLNRINATVIDNTVTDVYTG